MSRTGRPLAIAAGLLLAGTAAVVLAQQPQNEEAPQSDETFFESIDVSVVNVDVVVTDRSGRRVSGLTQDDFELREDGKPVAISNFYAVAGEQAAASPQAGGAAAPSATPANTAEPNPVPEEQRLYLTLFIDNHNLPAQARNQLLPALEKFLSTKMRPDDRLMLVSYDGDLDIRLTPTNDAASVVAEIDKLAKKANLGTHASLERRQVLNQLNTATPDLGPDAGGGGPGGGGQTANQIAAESDALSTISSIRTMAEKEFTQTRTTLATMSQLVDALSGLPGRKVFLYVGGGMSLRPGDAIMRAFLNKYPRMASQFNVTIFDGMEQDTTRLFEQLVQRANAHRVTFYTLGAPSGVSRASAEWADNSSYGADLESLDRVNVQAPLETLAAGTGGLAIYDPSDPSALMNRMREDFESYYSLGYVPNHKADGKTHKLEVLTRDRSLKARYREGFRAETAAERAASRTLSAMVLGVEQNPLDVALEFEDEVKDKKGNSVLSVLVKFPMAKLVLLPQEHVHEGRIKVFVGARDDQGRTSPITEVPVPIRIPNDQLLTALGQTATFRVQVAVRPGEQVIAVSVRDELGNADSTVTAKYTAGAKVASRTPA